MRVWPVLDLMDGWVVRGVGGRRDEYRPIESPLCDHPAPLTVATAFAERFDLRQLYLADLDAIAGAEPNWPVYRQLLEADFELCIDAGLESIERAAEMAAFSANGRHLAGIIAGLESSSGPEHLAAMLERIGAARLIFSLDLNGGVPLVLGAGSDWQGVAAEGIATTALEIGVRRMIVLDLAQVGSGAGVGTEGLCRWLREHRADLELIAGGGVRGVADLNALSAAGCDAALVASALHDGRLSREDLCFAGRR